ncbi:MAG: hypothetical protein DLM73_01045 [Chthoniobacterales bacterium]|nr:MAG: hypothetical protein DLM73_01045 [Chthoniobacterales bacterium]
MQILLDRETFAARITEFVEQRRKAGKNPFEELAEAERALRRPIRMLSEDAACIRRFRAILCRAGCYRKDAPPFDASLLRSYYKRHGDTVSSSTLSQMVK